MITNKNHNVRHNKQTSFLLFSNEKLVKYSYDNSLKDGAASIICHSCCFTFDISCRIVVYNLEIGACIRVLPKNI